MTKPSVEKRALALLEEALDRPSDERDAWVDGQTDGDYALRARMRQLLAGARSHDQLLTGGAATDTVETPPPERVGAYRIVEQLGRGGMGAVYKATRDSGDFDHVVAIKLIRPGALSSALIERFRRERQILAELAHPNIARLFDGGTTLNGEPFIIMEFVDGQPITQWADTRHLDVRGRLKLMLPVCAAVGFAHQNLIVHRDITPPNVLVTGEGVVKLIDFGISKPQDDEIDAEAAASGSLLSGLSLTPRFAAPERLSGAAATTLGDIYSLGRLLEALLEGQAVDADLAAIVAEATADDPAARYASVDAMAEDIERWLEGRAVAARRGGKLYEVGRFARRYRWAVGASAAGLAVIVAALVVSLISFAGAERARAAEAERFDQVRALAGYMLFDLNDALARTPGNTAARVALAQKAQTYLSALAASPSADAGLRLETARGLLRLARIQGVPPEPNFGDWKKAKANIATADALLGGLQRGGMTGAEIAPDQALADTYRGRILSLADGDAKAGAGALAAAETHLNAVPRPLRSERWHLARDGLRRAQAELLFLEQKDAEIGVVADRMDAERTEWPRALRDGRAGQETHAWASYYRGASRSAVGDGDFGVPTLMAAARDLGALDARWPNDPATLYALAYNDSLLFEAASRAGNQAVATQAITAAQQRIERLLTLEAADNSLNSLYINIGQAFAQDLSNRGLHAQAIARQRSALAAMQRRLTAERRPLAIADVGWAEMMLGLIARKAGDRTLTCESWRRARAAFAEVEARQALAGFHAGFQPGLKANLAKCDSGAPLSAFGPLKQGGD